MKSELTRWLTGILWGALLLGAAGCERMPWESKADSSQTTVASSSSQTPPSSGLAPVASNEQIAVVNQVPISLNDVELAIREVKQFTQAYGQEWKPLSTTESAETFDLHDVLENLIDSELKAQDVRARGLDRKTEVQRRLAYLQRGFYAQEWDRSQREQATPSEADIHQFYEDYKVNFVDPERIHVRQIVTNTLADAEAVRAKAIQGMVFAQLALESSIGPGKDAGGDVGWYLRALDRERLVRLGAAPSEQAMFPQLEPVAFALEAGQISQPVKGPDGRYYVVQLEERKPSRQQTELEVHDAIKELLTLQQLQRQLEDLRKKGKVERMPERLGAVEQ